MWSPPAPADWHEYIPGRRRESAVLIRQVTTSRLERLGLKSLTAFHDLANAFGSVKWEAMDRAAARLLGPNCLLGQQRHRRTWFHAQRGWPKQWQRRVDSTTNPLVQSRAKAERADAQEQLGPPCVHVWVAFLRSLAATRGLAPEHVAVLKSYWESNVLKSALVQLAAHVRHCRAKPRNQIEGKEGWTRIVLCLDPVTLPSRERWKQHSSCRKG